MGRPGSAAPRSIPVSPPCRSRRSPARCWRGCSGGTPSTASVSSVIGLRCSPGTAIRPRSTTPTRPGCGCSPSKTTAATARSPPRATRSAATGTTSPSGWSGWSGPGYGSACSGPDRRRATFATPSSTPSRSVAHPPLEPIEFDRLLKDVLSERFRVLVCDEAQWMSRECHDARVCTPAGPRVYPACSVGPERGESGLVLLRWDRRLQEGCPDGVRAGFRWQGPLAISQLTRQHVL